MDRWFGGKRRRKNNLLVVSFCGELLGFVGDCTITLEVVAMLVHL